MPLLRWKCSLEGFTGAPGVNTWHTITSGAASTSIVDAIQSAFVDFYTACAPEIQNDVDIVVPDQAEEIDEPSGQITSVRVGTVGALSVAGTGTTARPHFTMAKVQLKTSVYADGRLVQGGPYLGPMSGTVDQAGGVWGGLTPTRLADALDQLGADLTGLLAPLAVYRYPRRNHPTLPDRNGSAYPVSAFSIWNKPAVMRSRRD